MFSVTSTKLYSLLAERIKAPIRNKKGLTLFVSNLCFSYGADSGNRTCDLFITSELLYQLSHVGASNNIDNPQSFIKKKLIVDP